MLRNLTSGSKYRSSLLLFILTLIVGSVGAQATVRINTASGGYLVCVNSKTKVVTHPGTSTCPKGNKKLVLGAQGVAGANGLTGAAGIPGKDGAAGKDGKTLWNGVKDPENTWGAPGDMFINATTKTLFGPKNLDGTWPAGVSMVGPQGAQGPIGLPGLNGSSGGSGPAGATGATGATGPAGATGAQGPAGSNATLTCAQGGTCVLGDTGPGGGKVFYVQTATAAAPWRYMEAAANTWNGGSADPEIRWCDVNGAFLKSLLDGTTPSSTFTGAAKGTGARNTRAMVGTCAGGAANMAASYNGGGKSDWFLPSKDELNQLYLARTTVGGFVEDYYWSSTEYSSYNAWFQYFGDGSQGNFGKDTTFYVRPVRAF